MIPDQPAKYSPTNFWNCSNSSSPRALQAALSKCWNSSPLLTATTWCKLRFITFFRGLIFSEKVVLRFGHLFWPLKMWVVLHGLLHLKQSPLWMQQDLMAWKVPGLRVWWEIVSTSMDPGKVGCQIKGIGVGSGRNCWDWESVWE